MISISIDFRGLQVMKSLNHRMIPANTNHGGGEWKMIYGTSHLQEKTPALAVTIAGSRSRRYQRS